MLTRPRGFRPSFGEWNSREDDRFRGKADQLRDRHHQLAKRGGLCGLVVVHSLIDLEAQAGNEPSLDHHLHGGDDQPGEPGLADLGEHFPGEISRRDHGQVGIFIPELRTERDSY